MLESIYKALFALILFCWRIWMLNRYSGILGFNHMNMFRLVFIFKGVSIISTYSKFIQFIRIHSLNIVIIIHLFYLWRFIWFTVIPFLILKNDCSDLCCLSLNLYLLIRRLRNFVWWIIWLRYILLILECRIFIVVFFRVSVNQFLQVISRHYKDKIFILRTVKDRLVINFTECPSSRGNLRSEACELLKHWRFH